MSDTCTAHLQIFVSVYYCMTLCTGSPLLLHVFIIGIQLSLFLFYCWTCIK